MATGLDWPFLIAAALATTLLVMLVLIDGQPAAAALILGGFALGAVFLKTEFSFTAAWRRLIVRVARPNVQARTKQGYFAPLAPTVR